MKPYIMEEHENGVLLFRINREDKRNAVNYEVMEGLEKALELALQEHIKVLAITGTGDKAFCSGGDLTAFHGLKTEEEALQMLQRMYKLLMKLNFLPIPTIAVLNGAAVGGGCELASACDYRIAAPHARAGFIQGTLAITTGWGGGTLISEKILPSAAMKMLMEASLFNADQLKELGFIDAIFDGSPLQGCQEFLRHALNIEANVLKAYKKILIQKWVHSGLEKRAEEEIRRCAVLWEDEAHHKQVEKFLKK